MEVNPNLSEKAKKDYELVKKAGKGEEQAFTELLEKYRDSIYFMLLKKVNNEIDAEDLTIESFGKAFNNLSKYKPTYAFSTWLFKIANNNCVDFIRQKKHKHYSLENQINGQDNTNDNFDLTSDLLDPEERVIKYQKAEILNDIVKQLKPRYSKLIKLRYYYEKSYKEISEEMNIPIGTVKAQLFRSRELLKAMMKINNKSF